MAKRFFITTNLLGRDNDVLGALLMKNFIYTLARSEETPKAVMLVNEGVRLACSGSDSLDDLAVLVEKGVPVTACGTCLDFLGIANELSVGEVGTMPDSVAGLLADDVVTIG